MRSLGAVMIILCGLIFGLLEINKLKSRVFWLKDVESLVQSIRLNTSVFAMSFEEIIEKSCSKFAEQIYEYINAGYSPPNAWVIAAEKCIPSKDLGLIINYSSDFGKFDLSSEVDRTALFEEEIKKTIIEAKKDVADKGKMSLVLCFSVSAIIAVVLL